jgi:hypothetical protein
MMMPELVAQSTGSIHSQRLLRPLRIIPSTSVIQRPLRLTTAYAKPDTIKNLALLASLADRFFSFQSLQRTTFGSDIETAPAIDGQDLAGHVGCVQGQVGHGAGDVRGVSETLEGRAAQNGLFFTFPRFLLGPQNGAR